MAADKNAGKMGTSQRPAPTLTVARKLFQGE